MPTLTQRIALAVLIAPGCRAPKCKCGAYLTPRQQRHDGICRTCADAPAALDIKTSEVKGNRL